MKQNINIKVVAENIVSTEDASKILKDLGYHIYNERIWPDGTYYFFYLSKDEKIRAFLNNGMLKLVTPKGMG